MQVEFWMSFENDLSKDIQLKGEWNDENLSFSDEAHRLHGPVFQLKKECFFIDSYYKDSYI